VKTGCFGAKIMQINRLPPFGQERRLFLGLLWQRNPFFPLCWQEKDALRFFWRLCHLRRRFDNFWRLKRLLVFIWRHWRNGGRRRWVQNGLSCPNADQKHPKKKAEDNHSNADNAAQAELKGKDDARLALAAVLLRGWMLAAGHEGQKEKRMAEGECQRTL
jgi:hypothetical protein